MALVSGTCVMGIRVHSRSVRSRCLVYGNDVDCVIVIVENFLLLYVFLCKTF